MQHNHIEDVYELSPMQQGILFHDIYNPDSTSYFQQLYFKISANLNVNYFQQSWDIVIQRHPVLRTSFHWEGLEKPVQVVHQEVELPFQIIDSKSLSSFTDITQFLADERSRRFNLESAPNTRFILLKDQDAFHFIWNYHHLLLDGWCLPILLQEVFTIYQQLQSGNAWRLPPKGKNYREYLVWLLEQNQETGLNYWKEQLKGYIGNGFIMNALALTENKSKHQRSYSDIVMMVPKEVTTELQQLARNERITLSTIVQSAWAITLSNYCHQTDITFGYTVSGRSHSVEGAENIVGLFINTIPIRVTLQGDLNLLTWMKQLQQEQVEREKYSYVSLSDIHRLNTQPGRLLESIIAFENYPINEALQESTAGITLSDIRFFEQTDFPITLIITPGNEISIKCLYDNQLIPVYLIRTLMNYFIEVFTSICAAPNRSLQEVNKPSMLAEKDMVRYNTTIAKQETHLPLVHQGFELRAAQHGQRVAISHEGITWTYAELNRNANQWAHWMKEKGIGENHRVVICLPLKPETVCLMLAVMKTGAAYVPLDPSNPEDRLNAMITDCVPSMVFIAEPQENWKLTHTHCYTLDELIAFSASYSTENLPSHVALETPVYMIYTSGSTGVPKGVQITHSNLSNYVYWASAYYFRNRELEFALFTSIAFDLTVTSIYTPLVSGNRIRIYTPNNQVPVIHRILDENKVGILKLTPSHLKLIRDRKLPSSSIQCFIVGGEAFDSSLAYDIHNNFHSNVELYNEYGPTEATVGCMIHAYHVDQDQSLTVSVGVPISQTSIYLLDKNLDVVPTGSIGELYVSGAGVSAGYWQRDDLTAQKFLPDPFRPAQRMYKTGDLGRLEENQTITLFGREDQQIKHRGYRIELDEISHVLTTKVPEISQAVVQLTPLSMAETNTDILYCTNCGIPSNYPGIHFNSSSVCSYCTDFHTYKHKAHAYFDNMDTLREIFRNHATQKESEYDCLMLLSGGKDSTYVLYQLVKEMGLKVLVFSMDNGYISEEAKQNMRRVTDALGVDLIFGSTEAMNAIFVDSLIQFSNVCNGCFKTIYTLSVQLALKKKIKYIVTGLSRGQLFETRLNDLFCAGLFDRNEIDKLVLQTRKEYHNTPDAVSENLDTTMFKDGAVFEQIEFIDFFRYSQVELNDMYQYLDTHAPWVRPSDTGRSTNCLINDVGIYIHKKERGYHNYALPYSWDVRMGHKIRDEALHELHDELDVTKIRKILKEIGYDENYKSNRTEKYLIAYYTANAELTKNEILPVLKSYLPEHMIPSHYVPVKEIPLTVNGKIDYTALPLPGATTVSVGEYVAPRNETEKKLEAIWMEVLKCDRVSVLDNIFDLGGHSVMMTLIYSRIISTFGKRITMAELFDFPTIQSLAERLNEEIESSQQEEPTMQSSELRKDRQENVINRRQRLRDSRSTGNNM